VLSSRVRGKDSRKLRQESPDREDQCVLLNDGAPSFGAFGLAGDGIESWFVIPFSDTQFSHVLHVTAMVWRESSPTFHNSAPLPSP